MSAEQPAGAGKSMFMRPRWISGRLEAGDLLAFLYALALVRQAFWLVPEGVAWTATIGVAALLGILRVRARRPSPPLPAAFWLWTAGPLGLFWAAHLAYPDIGFDNLNYHILHGERALRGLLAIPGDFYPNYFPFLNPAPDILTALLRTILGYRLGTIGTFLVLVWTGAILFRFLERAIVSRVVCALAALWIVGSEGILWEVGGYMVDLYGLPLLLEAAFLVLSDEEEERGLLEDLPLIGLLLGSAVAFKLTNFVFAAAIGVVLLGRLVIAHSFSRGSHRVARNWGLAAIAFLLPMVPHALLLWWTTGSPVFPHYNALFRSTLFPLFNVGDGRFGPTSRLQALAWPVVSVFHPERLSEMGVTSGRLALGFLAAIAVLLARPRDRRLRDLAVVMTLGSILWSLGSGNHRYALFAELVGGLLLVLLAAKGVAASSGRRRPWRLLAWATITLLGLQSVLVVRDVARNDWGGRPTLFHEPRIAWKELLRVGSDRDLKRELPPELRNALPAFAGWVDAAPKTNGLMALLAPRLPVIGLGVGVYFELPTTQARFDEALRTLKGRPLASIALEENLELTKDRLSLHGFVVRKESRYELPFFSRYTLFPIVVLEVEAPPPLPEPVGRDAPVLSATDLVLRRPPASPGSWREDAGLLGSIDDPAEGAEVGRTFVVRGWARLPGQDLGVRVSLDGLERSPDEVRRTARLDVEAAIPELGSCATAGYEARLTLAPGDFGTHELAVVFRSRDGRERHYPGRRITVIAGR